MINTMFSCTSTFVSMNNYLSPCIDLHGSIRQGYALAPYLYVLIVDALGYLLESIHSQGPLRGLYLPRGNGEQPFCGDILLSMIIERGIVSIARDCFTVL
jgi:hypothetical protein